ncbi:MAG: penicillin-binding protein activator LpoB [Elusimicrobia bacterium]|nr:penicillin-binding protein activator LpoB [Elusimicrobiota bacterium]
MRQTFRWMILGMTGLLGACATTPKVTRVDPNETIDLSGNWNDTASRQVAEEMVKQALARPWLAEFQSEKKVKPRVIVGLVANKSNEHISTETFVKNMERELTNSGQVRFVASKEQREEIRDERTDQAKNASVKTAKSMGQEYGADFMLKGQINTIDDQAGKQQLRFYQVDLELIDLLTNEKVWFGNKEIKKTVVHPKRKF